MSAKIETLRPDHSAITGYVDELREDRVWGWAWDRRSPSLRVEIQVWIGDNPVAAALADRPRPDLKANGVGDGEHAFEIALPEATTETVSLLIRVMAKGRRAGADRAERRRRRCRGRGCRSTRPAPDLRRAEHVRSAQRVLGKAAHATLGDLRLSASSSARRPRPSRLPMPRRRSLAAIEAVLMRVDARRRSRAQGRAAARPGDLDASRPGSTPDRRGGSARDGLRHVGTTMISSTAPRVAAPSLDAALAAPYGLIVVGAFSAGVNIMMLTVAYRCRCSTAPSSRSSRP
jgi:hypothetical protein